MTKDKAAPMCDSCPSPKDVEAFATHIPHLGSNEIALLAKALAADKTRRKAASKPTPVAAAGAPDRAEHLNQPPLPPGTVLTPAKAAKRRQEGMEACGCRLCRLALAPPQTFAAWAAEGLPSGGFAAVTRGIWEQFVAEGGWRRPDAYDVAQTCGMVPEVVLVCTGGTAQRPCLKPIYHKGYCKFGDCMP